MIGVVIAAAALRVTAADISTGSQDLRPPPPCAARGPERGACRLPPRLSQEEASAILGSAPTAFRQAGDEFLVVARRDAAKAYLCCTIRAELDKVGGDLWAARFRVAALDEAIIEVAVNPGETAPTVFRGPRSPRRPEWTQALQGKVVLATIKSEVLGEERRITVYTPPGFDPARRYPLVYAADGQFRLEDAGYLEPLIQSGRVRPFVMIAPWAGVGLGPPDMRNREYLYGLPGGDGRFAKHERFFLEEVVPLAERRYGASTDPKDRLITGYSSGAAWALKIGFRHPEAFPRVAAFSLGWRGALAGAEADDRPALFITAGTLEPVYLEVTETLVERARRSPAPMTYRATVTGHTSTGWAPVLMEALEWAFPGPALDK